jgi:AdoMet-dependent heme synthase
MEIGQSPAGGADRADRRDGDGKGPQGQREDAVGSLRLPIGQATETVQRTPLRDLQIDFAQAPFLVIWETTQACALACRHCRASAHPWRDPFELNVEQGRAVVRQTAEMGTPLIVFTGGDPLNRPDIYDLIRYGKELGLRTATIPAATDTLDAGKIALLRRSGLDQMALSLDFPEAEMHDAFRGVPGAFAKTLQAAAWARERELPLQINTTVCGATAPFLERMADLVGSLGAVFWEVFFLIPQGRGTLLEGLTASECERVFDLIYRVQKRARFIVKVTEAPHYRRFVAQREGRTRNDQGHGRVQMPDLLTRSEGPGHTLGLAPRGVNSGNGFLFVSHQGEIFPSGFLPVSVGNVRTLSLAKAYRESKLFRELRDPERLKGRCGRCEFRDICGGSRSRAFALTGDPFQDDPWCAYEPQRVASASPALAKTLPC